MENREQRYRPPTGTTRAMILVLTLTLIGLPLILGLIQAPSARGDLYTEMFGNITNVNKPVPSVHIEQDEIPIGGATTFIYNLEKNHRYHVYLTGDWADPENPETDYDIYVYRIDGSKVIFTSSHTESSGLPEQVGNDAQGQYFTATHSGLYYFTVRNDAIESAGAKPGTLMILENLDDNRWYSRAMEGKINEVPQTKTTWSYEFVSSAPRIKIYVDVPSSLDMYEARLYVMGNPQAGKGVDVKGVPIAWEPGLNAEVSGEYGGFNLEQKGYRRLDAMASCETTGQDMVIDFDTPVSGETLYNLALIAEYGVGTINFIVQTDFDPPSIVMVNPPTEIHERVFLRLKAEITDESGIEDISFAYREEGSYWKTSSITDEGDSIYSALVPPTDPRTTVEYKFEATDMYGQTWVYNSSYEFMPQTDFDTPVLTPVDPPSVVEEKKNNWIMVNIQDESHIDDVSCTYTYDGGETRQNAIVFFMGEGNYSAKIPPVQPGQLLEYTFEVVESNSYTSELSGSYHTIGKGDIDLQITGDTVPGGSEIQVLGTLYPSGRSMNIVFTHSEDQQVYNVTSNEYGSFEHFFRPDSSGEWQVHAEYPGEEYYLSYTTEPINFTVTQLETMITCQVDVEKVELGDSLTITGQFSQLTEGLSVKVFLSTGDAKYSKITTTKPDGSFTAEYTPEAKGEWTIEAKAYSDGLVFDGAESEPVTLQVVNPSLTTMLLRLPGIIYSSGAWLLDPPYLYGVVGLVGVAGGGAYILYRRREE